MGQRFENGHAIAMSNSTQSKNVKQGTRRTATSSAGSGPESAGRATTGVDYDPQSLMRIKSLELRAKVVVEGFMNGIHRSPFHGFSVEFTDYRQYSPGDDLRYLDWRLLARSDRYYIKRFEDETNLRCHLLVDMSKSMGYGTVGWSKADYAKTAAATFAYFLAQQRDAVGLMTFDQSIGEYIPARFRPGHLRRLMLSLERSLEGESTDVSGALEQIAKTVRKRGLIVLISDLLSPIESLQKSLGYLRSQGHEVAIFRVLDPTEVHFDFKDSAMFHDRETGKNLYVDPAATRAHYLKQFRAHEQEVQSICDQLGIDFHRFETDKPLEQSFANFVLERANRKSQVQRSTGFTGSSISTQGSDDRQSSASAPVEDSPSLGGDA